MYVAQHRKHTWKQSDCVKRLCGNETLLLPSQDKDRRGVRQESLQALPDPLSEPGRRVSEGERQTPSHLREACHTHGCVEDVNQHKTTLGEEVFPLCSHLETRRL